MTAVVLLSGGLDSTTAASIAIAEHSEAIGLSVSYGQTHSVEVEAAARIADELGMRHVVRVLDPDLMALEGSALTGSAPMPNLTYKELGQQTGPSPTYVPFRNGLLLSIAAALALQDGASEVWAGMHSEDAHQWAYPDCTPEFLGAMAAALYVGTYHAVRLVTPLQWMTKAQVLATAIEYGSPYHLTVSCYQGIPACGTCPTCVGRAEAFRLCGVDDPAAQHTV